MRIATEANVLEAEGTLSARRSTLKTSRKTFRMVIDGIYSNKVGAIVQEIAANAYDSHLRAKQDRPFFVHCPTALNPEFFIRDYGVGMTDEVMGNVYIVVGESDKDLSDDEVGMWGLGSKTPFAYGDMYHITCYDGETARHYGYGIAEDGIPTLYLMDTQPCDEPRGVRIGFAVESADYQTFEKEIRRVALGHTVAFESNLTLKPRGDLLCAGEDWQCFSEPNPSRTSNWFVRQGCILYPVAAPVETPSDYSKPMTFVLDCPIGTVKVTTSREAIAYEPEVVDYLNSRVKRVLAEMRAAIWERIKDIKSVAEFFEEAKKLRPSFVPDDFVHPATGLKKPSIEAAYPGLFLTICMTDKGRWEFATPNSLAVLPNPIVGNVADMHRGKPAPALFLLDDIDPLLDPSRERSKKPAETPWLSKSEVRRVTRFTRAYLEGRKLSSAQFFCNVDWDKDFLAACFPGVKVTRLTFDDLRKAVPRREAPTVNQTRAPIRGLAFAKGAGEQKPVFEVTAPEDKSGIAWVSSEQYRRQAAGLFKLGKRFELTALYIAAPQAQQQMADAGIPHMRDLIDAKLVKDGMSFSDWYYAKDKLNDYNIRQYITFLRSVLQQSPEAYDKLAAGKGEYSVIAKTSKRLLGTALFSEITDEDRKALDALLVADDGTTAKPDVPKDLKAFDSAVKVISTNAYYNPTCKFVGTLQTGKTADVAGRLVDALLSMQTLIPPSEKFN
jgi:hypothetical protein